MAINLRSDQFVDQAHQDRMRFYNSPEWHVLRNRVKERAAGICERCHLRAVREIDHKTYERFGGEELLSDLQGLCGPCHDKKHNLLGADEEPAPSWAGFYGPVMRQHGLLREVEPAPWPSLAKKLTHLQMGLAGSAGEAFLSEKRIPMAIAQQFGLGWERASKNEAGIEGRLVFPGTNPYGDVISLLGRAVPKQGNEILGTPRWVSEGGRPAYVGASTLRYRCNAVVCNNAFDALALAAAGAENVVAVAGTSWRWAWAIPLRKMTLSFDPMTAGSLWERIGYEAEIMNMPIAQITPEHGDDDWTTMWADGASALVKSAVEEMRSQ